MEISPVLATVLIMTITLVVSIGVIMFIFNYMPIPVEPPISRGVYDVEAYSNGSVKLYLVNTLSESFNFNVDARIYYLDKAGPPILNTHIDIIIPPKFNGSYTLNINKTLESGAMIKIEFKGRIYGPIYYQEFTAVVKDD